MSSFQHLSSTNAHAPAAVGKLKWLIAAAALAALAAPVPTLTGAEKTPSGAIVANSQESGKKRIGVAGFKTGEGEDAFSSRLADMLVTELMQNRNYDLVERNRLNELMKEQGLGMTGILDESNAARVGKVAGMDYIVLGSTIAPASKSAAMEAAKVAAGVASDVASVNESAEKFGLKKKSNPFAKTAGSAAADAVQKMDVSTIDLTVYLKVVEVETGKIVLSVEGKNKKSTLTQAGTNLEEHKALIAKGAIKEAASIMMARIAPPYAKVLKAEKDGRNYKEVTIDYGSDYGVVNGAKWVIFKEGEVLTDPHTGDVVDVEYIDIANLTIKTVNQKSSVAKVDKVLKDPKTKNQFEISRGDLAKMQVATKK